MRPFNCKSVIFSKEICNILFFYLFSGSEDKTYGGEHVTQVSFAPKYLTFNSIHIFTQEKNSQTRGNLFTARLSYSQLLLARVMRQMNHGHQLNANQIQAQW